VTAVSTAVGGLKAFLENRDSLDLVITDMVLPDHKGTWLIDRIFSEIPDMKVVVISGYPLSSDEVRVPSYARIHWIQKPVSIHTLSRELREMFPGGK